MAKVVIEIEDMPGNRVSVKATPNFETICKMDLSGHTLTSAHGYAVAMLNTARQISKSNDPKNVILIPRVGKA